MKTVEEFAKIVREENQKHNEELMKLDNKTLIVRAREIAKWQAIFDYMEGKVIPYLEEEEEMFKDFLTLEIDNPIAEIYGWEFNYDEPQWTTWENLDDVVHYMFEEIKNKNN